MSVIKFTIEQDEAAWNATIAALAKLDAETKAKKWMIVKKPEHGGIPTWEELK